MTVLCLVVEASTLALSCLILDHLLCPDLKIEQLESFLASSGWKVRQLREARIKIDGEESQSDLNPSCSVAGQFRQSVNAGELHIDTHYLHKH